eukprot:6103077-Ditylum_brightwellii.AAC.1
MHASGLDPMGDLGVTRVKGSNGRVNLNIACSNQYVTLPVWRGRLKTEPRAEELVNKIQPVFAGSPSKEELMNATKYSPLDWECEISGIEGQSEESLGEQ